MESAENLIIKVGEQLEIFAAANDCACSVCFGPAGLVCIETMAASFHQYFVKSLTADQVKNGLTGPQWVKLGKALFKKQEEVQK